jgi:Holliday junction DNA helicase RuvA
MIGTLTGKITQLNPPELILEVNGIGYEINCPLPTFYKISESETITLHTHFQVKEDLQALYGFLTESEKKLFRELIKVNGIGPKVALAILSHLEPGNLIDCISREDVDLISKTPGIGKKTAQKLIVELKDRVAGTQVTGIDSKPSHNDNALKARQALESLCFKSKEIEKMLGGIDTNLSTEEIIKAALKNN